MPEPKGPVELPFIGSILSLRENPPEFFARLAADYGNVARFSVFGREALLLSHPDLIQEVLIEQPKNFRKSRGLQLAKALLGDGLLTSEGDFHKRQRRLSSPAFARSRMAKYAEDMVRISERHVASYPAGVRVDANQLMMRLTLAIVNKTLFDADVSAEADTVADALEVILNNMDRILNPFTEILNVLPLPSTLRLREAQAKLDKIVYGIIADRRKNPGDRGDLLSIYMSASDDEATGAMTDKQIRDECMTLFIAGHETTANALAWALYLLAANGEWLKKARAELREVTGDRPVTADDYPKLKLLQNIFAETLRLYPPAWTISREALVDTQIKGYEVKAGTTVVMSQWVMHRHPAYWSNPAQFDPARFNPDRAHDRAKFTYFPFGGGSRQCIGDQFASIEGVLILAVFLQHFEPCLIVPGYTAEIHPMITLRPRGGMPLVLRGVSK
ncbi:cytochrome P450 [Turneriella parva]|uniref:Cytochrome P450 n=1 Tax=Turneriella parva (strain ATCC BAA-1111 / DSM 21527 / NCTC 11395 / H) TaxID=869212 RepID=I4B1B2_TURPD|nr:cytochrome P450 [Turneriella parva]AFM11069.1 cytochrome P450 [Turneriella parva DSM 21527]